jgi:hypothetical protein
VDNFISATDEDIRYWVREIRKPKKETTNLLEEMQNEIPAFLDFLEKRKISTDCESRAWFRPALLRTQALQNVIEASKPAVLKILEHDLKEMFFKFATEEFFLSPTDIKDMFFSKMKYDIDYITKSIVNRYPDIERYKNKEGRQSVKRYKIPYHSAAINEEGEEILKVLYKPAIGRPFHFKAPEILTPSDYDDLKTYLSETTENILPF